MSKKEKTPPPPQPLPRGHFRVRSAAVGAEIIVPLTGYAYIVPEGDTCRIAMNDGSVHRVPCTIDALFKRIANAQGAK